MAMSADTGTQATAAQAGRDVGHMVRAALEALEAEWYDDAILACEAPSPVTRHPARQTSSLNVSR